MREAKRWDDIQEKPTLESDIIGNSSSIPHSSMKMHADPVPFFFAHQHGLEVEYLAVHGQDLLLHGDVQVLLLHDM
jgi:hypothetical protein